MEDSNTDIFHPSFQNLWQVQNGAILLQRDTKLDNNNIPVLQAPSPAATITVTTSQEDDVDYLQKRFREGSCLLAGQVVEGSAVQGSSAWIKTVQGYYVPRQEAVTCSSVGEEEDATLDVLVAAAVKPYWPTYRVVANTHNGVRGIAPYVLDSSATSKVAATASDRNDGAPVTAARVLLPEILKQEYDPESPLRDTELAKSIGHVFENAEKQLLVETSNDGVIGASNWWTEDDGTTTSTIWWPKTVPQLDLLGVPLPRKVLGCIDIPPKTVTEWAAPMASIYIKVAFQGRGSYLIVAMILTEYLMIAVGAVAGVGFGWSVQLQLTYAVFLVLLVSWEIAIVAVLLPNGRLWLKINKFKLPLAIFRSVIWRWDLYSDVGFAILAFQERDRISAPLWIFSTVFSVIVICGRLLYSSFHMKSLVANIDEKNLAKVSVPSFMTVFQLLCQTMNSDEGTEARRLSARTELGFEMLRSLCEDFPEIGIQAAYLYGGDAPPACSTCAYGFVVTSLLLSIATSVPGVFRLFNAYQRYMNVTSEISDKERKDWQSSSLCPTPPDEAAGFVHSGALCDDDRS